MKFTTIVELGGKTATGLPVPDEIIEALGTGARPAVTVTIGGYTYRTTVARMGGRFFVPLAADHRAAAKVSAGDEVEVDIELDTAPREVRIPDDLAAALDEKSSAFLASLSYTNRKEWVRWIEDAKKAETRSSRIAKAAADLAAGKRTH